MRNWQKLVSINNLISVDERSEFDKFRLTFTELDLNCRAEFVRLPFESAG